MYETGLKIAVVLGLWVSILRELCVNSYLYYVRVLLIMEVGEEEGNGRKRRTLCEKMCAFQLHFRLSDY